MSPIGTEVVERTPTTPTRTSARVAALLGYAVLLGVWSRLIGIPNDTVGVVVWVWLATVAWRIEAPTRSHLDFWRDWWRPLLCLVVYWFLRGLADQTWVSVHFTAPVRFDQWLGGGVTPTERLQHAWCGDPCLKATPPRWYDVVLTTVYATHFLTALVLAGVLWVRSRGEWQRWIRRFVALNIAGLAVYFAYPMAPPWLAAREGYLGEVHRTTSRGWSELDLHRTNIVLHGMANKVAAMPSLHAATACLVAGYAIWRLSSPLRWALVLYPVAMSLALVYSGEHYVLDVLCGALLALAVLVGCAAWERRYDAGAGPPPVEPG